jgi:hypothetical protein
LIPVRHCLSAKYCCTESSRDAPTHNDNEVAVGATCTSSILSHSSYPPLSNHQLNGYPVLSRHNLLLMYRLWRPIRLQQCSKSQLFISQHLHENQSTVRGHSIMWYRTGQRVPHSGQGHCMRVFDRPVQHGSDTWRPSSRLVRHGVARCRPSGCHLLNSYIATIDATVTEL